MEPKIYTDSTVGFHNEDLQKSIERIDKSMMYEDLSTIIICPTRGMFPTRVVQSWMKMLRPTNQTVAGPIFAESMKVDHAYNTLIEYILNNDYLKDFKYVLTIEEDNLPPSDGLLKLYEGMKEYDAVGGLYWTKKDTGFPMIYGDPEKPGTFQPQTPTPNTLQRCNGLGMGFTLFKLDMFRQMEGPWFKTKNDVKDNSVGQMTQDLYFFNKAAKQGFKFACDTRVLVGHYDSKEDKIY